MDFYNTHILTVVLFTPLVGALVLLFVPRDSETAHRVIGNLFALPRADCFAAADLALQPGPRRAALPVSGNPTTGFPPSARTIRWASTASACCSLC